MFLRGLKPSIIVYLVLLITTAMLLIDLVMLGSLRQELLRSRLNAGISFMALAGPLLVEHEHNSLTHRFQEAMKETNATCMMVLNEEREAVQVTGWDCDSQPRMRRKAGDSLKTGDTYSTFYGKTWGIILPGRKSLVVSYPFETVDGTRWSAAIQLSLASYYEALRNSQRVFSVYFLINLLILTLLGFHSLYRTLIQPINNLVSTAEEFKDNDEFSFSLNNREGEFNILSRSLNKMLSRINKDRHKLEESVRSLEKTNLELHQAQQEVVRAEKLATVGRLSAGIAHEIGNPVGIVIGYLDLLKQENISEDKKNDFLARAESEVYRINTIIRQLLDFARQPQDEPDEVVSVHKIINEVEDICRVQPLMAEISISTELSATNDQVLAPSGQLKQIFINLLINGADAINSTKDADGSIRISTSDTTIDDEKPSIAIIFEDNGPGVEPDQLHNIFDPFYTTKAPGKGTGLGLSICFTLVEGLGGTIKADTSEDGMRITINLPASAQGFYPEKASMNNV